MNDGDSEVVDPVTGRVREFSNSFNNNWNVSFRQDVPEHGFSYGFSFGGGGSATSYRLTETFTRQRTAGDLQLFVETNRIAGLKVRVGWNDIFDRPLSLSARSTMRRDQPGT
jgi:hypothetical protein